ncbi:hypothetical protein ACQ4LE_005675 [Meloidogyne hapla]
MIFFAKHQNILFNSTVNLFKNKSKTILLPNGLAMDALKVLQVCKASNVAHQDDEHHELFHGVPVVPNPGPNITFDYFPVPCKPFKPVYDDLQRKFNLWLLAGFSVFAFSLFMIYYTDATVYEAWALPKSYRDRHRINAELRAKEAAEKTAEGKNME